MGGIVTANQDINEPCHGEPAGGTHDIPDKVSSRWIAPAGRVVDFFSYPRGQCYAATEREGRGALFENANPKGVSACCKNGRGTKVFCLIRTKPWIVVRRRCAWSHDERQKNEKHSA